MFKSALEQGLVLFNPAGPVRAPKIKPLEREVFSRQEIGALLAVAEPEWRTMIVLAYYCGARLGDLASLDWDDIDLSAGLLSFRQDKMEYQVRVPLHPELSAHLMSIAGDQHGPVCPALARRALDGRGGLSAQFVKLMDQAGIDRRQVQSGRNRFSRKSFHSLRHSFVSALVESGIAPELRMKLAGHRNLTVHALYSHHQLRTLQGAIDSIPAVRIP
jgi:integrase